MDGAAVEVGPSCPPELEAEFVVSKTLITVKQLKDLKVPSRERDSPLICTVCRRGFKSIDSAQNHVQAKAHKVNRQGKHLDDVLPHLVLPPGDKLLQFVDYIFLNHSAVMQGQESVRHDLVTQLEVLVQEQFPDVTVELHGSSVSGFALVTSNVNISLTIPETVSEQNKIPSVMKGTLSVLRSKSDLYAEVREDFFAFNRIPRILFLDKKSGLNCEVRANAGNPVVLARLLRLYSSIDDRVKKLGVIFQHWAKVCGVDVQENGHYPSHMFVIMTIHYLQQRTPPVLPVLHESYPDWLPSWETVDGNSSERITVEGISKLSEALQSWQVTNNENIGELWHGMLRYYSLELDIAKVAVSICQSKSLIRESRQWGTARLAVEDPLIPRSNFARAASSDKVFAYLMSSLKQSLMYFSEGETCNKKQKNQLGLKNLSPSKQVEHDGKTEGNDILFVAFNASDISMAETADFIFQNSATCITDLAHASTTPVKSQATKLPLTDVDSIQFGSFPEVNVAPFKSISWDLQPEDFGSDKLEEKELNKKDVVKVEDSGDMATYQHEAETVSFHMQHKYLVFQDYPTACLNCKQKGHIATDCPEENFHVISTSLPRMAPNEQSLRSMTVVLKSFVRSVKPNQEGLLHRQNVCDQILRDIVKVYPGAKLELFGSSANGFGLWNSDLDLCLTLPTHDKADSDMQMDKDSQNNVIQTIAEYLAKHRMYDNIVPITSARVPIVKFRLPKLQLQGDISLENRLALRNTKMMLAYAKTDKRVRLLGYVVKHFAKVCEIGDASSGSLSSYAYILLVIHYLQRTTPPVIPVLQKLYHTDSKGRVLNETLEPLINTWNCYYFEFENVSELVKVWSGLSKNKENVAKLWLGFLRYYIQFDWATEVVTIRDLNPLKKVDKWWMSKHMCIEDPFNLDHNLAAAVSGRMRNYILERFRAALFYNSQNIQWKFIDQLLDKQTLVGDTRVPKFLICNICNQRGHKASICPKANSYQNAHKKVNKRQHSAAVHQNFKSIGTPTSAVPIRPSARLSTYPTVIPIRPSFPMHTEALHMQHSPYPPSTSIAMYENTNRDNIEHLTADSSMTAASDYSRLPHTNCLPQNYHYHLLQPNGNDSAKFAPNPLMLPSTAVHYPHQD